MRINFFYMGLGGGCKFVIAPLFQKKGGCTCPPAPPFPGYGPGWISIYRPRRNRLSPKSLDNFTFGNSYFKKLDQNQINRTGFVYLPFQNIFVVLNLVLLTGLTDILRIFCYNNLPRTFSVFFCLNFSSF